MFSCSALTAVILAAACASSVHAVAVKNCARTYTVVAGDTCDGISAKENVSTFQLASVNEGIINVDCSNLFVGETLCLGIAREDCQANHVVALGDTCQSIAAGAGTTVDLILENNPNVNEQCSNIYPGEVLCVAHVIVYPFPGPAFQVRAANPTLGSGSTDFPITRFRPPIPTPDAACGPKCCTVC